MAFACTAHTDNAELENLHIEWLKDDVPLDNSDPNIEISSDGIRIEETSSADTANYTCWAHNRIDEAKSVAELKVRGEFKVIVANYGQCNRGEFKVIVAYYGQSNVGEFKVRCLRCIVLPCQRSFQGHCGSLWSVCSRTQSQRSVQGHCGSWSVCSRGQFKVIVFHYGQFVIVVCYGQFVAELKVKSQSKVIVVCYGQFIADLKV